MRKILLADDDPFIRDITSVKLAEYGYSIVVAPCGKDVLPLIDKEKPDAVLLDLGLPDITGFEILQTVQEHPEYKNVAFVVFSNNDDPKVKDRATELGAAAFFVKATTNFDDLHAKLSALLGPEKEA